MSCLGKSGIPSVAVAASSIIDMALRGEWTPKQQASGDAIGRANAKQSTQEPLRDAGVCRLVKP
jgi:hypothetical protein